MTNAATLYWLNRQSPAVRQVWKEFPHMTKFMIDGRKHWIIGYEELRQTAPSLGGSLATSVILSSIDPNRDYDAALAHGPHKVYLTVAELRKLRKLSK